MVNSFYLILMQNDCTNIIPYNRYLAVLPLHIITKYTYCKVFPFYSSRWLCNPQIDTKTRNWAIEGLAYLTNDADVKDDFVEDEPAMKAMFELAKV